MTAPSARTNSVCLPGGIGTQTGPRQSPAGSSAQPVLARSTGGASHRFSPPGSADARLTLPSEAIVMVVMDGPIESTRAGGKAAVAGEPCLLRSWAMEIPQTTPPEAFETLRRHARSGLQKFITPAAGDIKDFDMWLLQPVGVPQGRK